jgi:hypothetical protein
MRPRLVRGFFYYRWIADEEMKRISRMGGRISLIDLWTEEEEIEHGLIWRFGIKNQDSRIKIQESRNQKIK